MKTRKYSTEELREAVRVSLSLAACLRLLNVVPAGGNYQVARRLIEQHEIDTSHFTASGCLQGQKPGPRKPLEEYLTNTRRITSHRLKTRLLGEDRIEARCNVCKRTHWMGQRIPLELHHIDGDTQNNALSNLVLLCPNCHALTNNYRGRNKKRRQHRPAAVPRANAECSSCKSPCTEGHDRCRSCYRVDSRKVDRPSREALAALLWQKPTLQIGRDFGVSDQSVANWARQYGLPKPPRGYWNRKPGIEKVSG